MDSIERVLELLCRCTVKLSVPEETGYGTGFFVARSRILSCAHVVETAQRKGTPVNVEWNGQSYTAQIDRFLDKPDPDLALLTVDSLTNHPCVLLYEEISLNDNLYSYGYTDEYPGGESSTFVFEGWTTEPQLLKLKAGQARPGLSGAPVLNQRTGGICGIIKRSRGIATDLGGRVIPTTKIIQIIPDLKQQQVYFHRQDQNWTISLSSQQREYIVQSFDVVLSYCDVDADLIERIVEHLKSKERFRIYLDKWVLGNSGQSWQQTENDSLFQSECYAICVGKSTPIQWAQEVSQAALHRGLEGTQHRIIPVLLPGVKLVDVESFPDLTRLVDFRSNTQPEYGLEMLIRGIKNDESRKWVSQENYEKLLEAVDRLLNRGLIDENVSQSHKLKVLEKYLL